MGTSLFQSMAEKWPSAWVARTESEAFTGGIMSEKYLANLDSQGKGPAGRVRVGRKIAYPVTEFISGLKHEAPLFQSVTALNKGAANMGRNKKNKLPPFVAIFKDMLKSEAWLSISNPARVAYVHLKSKCVTANNDFITLSYQEMERVMQRKTFAGAISQLEKHGFIIREQRGGLYRKRNYFRFSEQWKNFKTE